MDNLIEVEDRYLHVATTTLCLHLDYAPHQDCTYQARNCIVKDEADKMFAQIQELYYLLTGLTDLELVDDGFDGSYDAQEWDLSGDGPHGDEGGPHRDIGGPGPETNNQGSGSDGPAGYAPGENKGDEDWNRRRNKGGDKHR